MPRKVFVAGEILTAADVNTNLMDQAVMVFDDDAARTTAIPTPSEGMVTYLKDTNAVEKYDGAAFVNVDTGKILQVVSTTKTDTFTTASTTFTALTGLTASITPSSTSSKVLVIVSIEGASTNGAGASLGVFRLMRDSTPIAIADAEGSRQRGTGQLSTRQMGSSSVTVAVSKSVLDTPNTTSAITYGAEVRVGGGTLFINRTEDNADATSVSRNVSTLTLMEVAG